MHPATAVNYQLGLAAGLAGDSALLLRVGGPRAHTTERVCGGLGVAPSF